LQPAGTDFTVNLTVGLTSDEERGFYLRMGYAGRARLHK